MVRAFYLLMLPYKIDNKRLRSARGDEKCVAKAVTKFSAVNPTQDILICWEHKELHKIAKQALGIKHAPDYPDEQ